MSREKSSTLRSPRRSVTQAARKTAGVLSTLSARGAQAWPDSVALICGRERITFAELHAACTRLARLLLGHGVRPGDRVALLGSKDIDTVVALLSVCMVGAAYVPLDPQLPARRLRYMLDDVSPRLVLGRSDLYQLAEGREFLDTQRCREQTLPQASARELPHVSPEAIAYVMYTSGSTGVPKGVVIEQRGVEAFFSAHNARVGIGAGHRCMNTGPFHFDVSVMDVLLPLHFGATTILTPELPLAPLLLDTIARLRVTHFYAIGTVLALMTGDGSALDRYDLGSLQVLQTGAETCNPRVVNQWLSRVEGLRFLNSYGPTEASVGCVCYAPPQAGLLPPGDVPIGKIHDGCQFLLVDEQGRPLRGPRAAGELLVAGAQVMRGYWNRPNEQAAAITHIDGVRYYRTGDQVYLDEHGLLHYLGRHDRQLKIDGCRIELDESRRLLEQKPWITSASVASFTGKDGRTRLGAALVTQAEPSAKQLTALHEELSRELPSAALPSGYLVARELPRTSSGKTDVRACMVLLQLAVSRHPHESAFCLGDGVLTPLNNSSTSLASLQEISSCRA